MSENELLTTLQQMMNEPDAAKSLSIEAVNRMTLAVLLNLDRRMRDVEKVAPAVRVILWVGAAIGASIVSLIWSVITGQAAIVFS